MFCCSEPFTVDEDRTHTNYMITIKVKTKNKTSFHLKVNFLKIFLTFNKFYSDFRSLPCTGTKSKIELQFFGTDEKTSKIVLNRCFENGFNIGSKLTINRQLEDIGKIKMLKISLFICKILINKYFEKNL